MTLVLEVEFLSGVSFAAVGPDSDAPDWPPQPDRIFSALVASWAARGEDGGERAALGWLERRPVPILEASAAAPRTAPLVFVPPNDPRSDKGKHAKGVLPALRSRQPRRFPAARPEDPVVRLHWEDEPLDAVFGALQRLAGDTAYVGHSASLTRCWFRRCEEVPIAAKADPDRPVSGVYDGRFAELRRSFDAGRRPSPGVPVRPQPREEARDGSVFGERWMILEHLDGEMPDLRAGAIVGKAIRDTVLSGYARIGLDDAIPEVVSGHAADGAPTRDPHLAVVPLPFVGSPYADGHVLGFALVPPQGCAIFDDQTFRRAMRKVAPPIETSNPRRVMTIRLREGIAVLLSPTLEPPAGKRSLDSELYTAAARTFATVTPMVLDRHLKQRGEAREAEIRAQIAAACRNIGLPEPDEIVADKHSALEGAPSAYPSGSAPAWMRWRLPPSLASRQLTHAVLRFGVPVRGPVVLGAGRFVGLGLCRPIDAVAR